MKGAAGSSARRGQPQYETTCRNQSRLVAGRKAIHVSTGHPGRRISSPSIIAANAHLRVCANSRGQIWTMVECYSVWVSLTIFPTYSCVASGSLMRIVLVTTSAGLCVVHSRHSYAKLIPVFEHTIQVTRDKLATLPRMPLHRQDRGVTCLDLVPHLASLPIPKTHVPATISRTDKLSIRTYGHIRCIARNVVAPVRLLSILSEPVSGGIDRDLVIRRLERNVFAGRMRRGSYHGEHVGLGDEFDGHGNAILPGSERLVV